MAEDTRQGPIMGSVHNQRSVPQGRTFQSYSASLGATRITCSPLTV